MANSLSHFTSKVKSWNKGVYGHIGHCKKRLVQELTRIQKVKDYSHSDYLYELEMMMRTELENVLHHEKLWKQNARCDSLLLGDKNTIFFHSQMIQRRKHNRITKLKNDVGEWILDEEEL
ncbi:hypothetical protein J1N35_008053 [Gossypium stocksii]|uniref:Uncharacterized protein n=1 Tax=Gossypium stocksii TaxID=47602 RepID=A0A9D4AG51_9ROSI|nr:hypothetical protein J1N35_008053 [Gossypium stocksii]